MGLNRRTLLAGGLAAGAAGLLSGCGGGAENVDHLLMQAAELPRGRAELSWWVAEVPSRRGPVVADLVIRAFERKHPNIRVNKINALATTDADRAALAPQLAGGSPQPDVFLGDSTWPAQFGDSAMALPLERLLPKDYWDAYPDALRDMSVYRGHCYALPFFTDSAYLFYRKDLLAKHGLHPPRSWEDVLHHSRKVQRAGDIDCGFLWQASVTESLTCNVTEFLADAGVEVLGRDGRVALGGPGAERAFALMREFTASGVSPQTVTTYVEADSQAAFTAGRGLFLRNWSYAWANAADPKASPIAGKVGMMLRPGFAGSHRSGISTAGGWSNFVNPGSDQLGAAVAFARFCAGEEVQRLLAREAAVIPAMKSVLHGPEARRTGDPTVLRDPELHLVARPVQSPHYPQLSKALYTAGNAVAGGRTTPAAAVRQAAAGVRSALEGKAQ